MSEERRRGFAERIQRKVLSEVRDLLEGDTFNELDEVQATKIREQVTQVIFDMLEAEIP
jgi:hypothetical protein